MLQSGERSLRYLAMKDRVYISQLRNHVGAAVVLHGWVHRARASGKIAFLTVRDGSGLCQCVVEKNEATASFFDAAKKLPQETSLRIAGKIYDDERAVGGVEMRDVTDCVTIGASADYPITPKTHGPDFLMKHRHLWFRSQRQFSILRIRATVVDAIRQFFNSRDFVLIDTPIFAPAIGESASSLFEVDYFGEPVFLAQTGQRYLAAIEIIESDGDGRAFLQCDGDL